MDRVLRLFEPKRDEVIGGCRKLHNEELRSFVHFANYNQNDEAKEDDDRECRTNGVEDECI
jgi:hypothetical protein